MVTIKQYTQWWWAEFGESECLELNPSLIVIWLWVDDIISLWLRFLNCKFGITILISKLHWKNYMKYTHKKPWTILNVGFYWYSHKVIFANHFVAMFIFYLSVIVKQYICLSTNIQCQQFNDITEIIHIIFKILNTCEIEIKMKNYLFTFQLLS